MSCPEQIPLIESYFDQELDLIRSLEIEKHIASCASCAEHLKHMQALRTTIHAARLNEPAPASLRKWAGSLQEARGKKTWAWNGDLIRRWMPIAGLAAVSAMVFVSLPFLGPTRGESRQADEIVSAHVRSLMVGHLMDVISTDQHTVKPWFNGKLDFAPWVRDLAEYEFPLKGGRLEYLEHRPVAALVYQRHQHIINLFLWPLTEARDRAPATLSVRGYHLIHWTKSGMTYWVVSDLNNQELQQFAQLVQNQTLFP